jgi:hypothetical protein
MRANRLRALVDIHKTGIFWARGRSGMWHWMKDKGLVTTTENRRVALTVKGHRAMRVALQEYTDKGRLSDAFPPHTRDIPRASP